MTSLTVNVPDNWCISVKKFLFKLGPQFTQIYKSRNILITFLQLTLLCTYLQYRDFCTEWLYLVKMAQGQEKMLQSFCNLILPSNNPKRKSTKNLKRGLHLKGCCLYQLLEGFRKETSKWKNQPSVCYNVTLCSPTTVFLIQS